MSLITVIVEKGKENPLSVNKVDKGFTKCNGITAPKAIRGKRDGP
jgi:hypothetical protein